MTALTFLIDTLCSLYISVILIRLWLHWARAIFTIRLANLWLKPLRLFSHRYKNLFRRLAALIPQPWSWPTWCLAANFLCLPLSALAKFPIWMSLWFQGYKSSSNLAFCCFGAYSLARCSAGLAKAKPRLNLCLAQLTEPMLEPIRRVVPPMGGLDLSILVLFIGLQALNFLMGDLIPFGTVYNYRENKEHGRYANLSIDPTLYPPCAVRVVTGGIDTQLCRAKNTTRRLGRALYRRKCHRLIRRGPHPIRHQTRWQHRGP